jgi:para-nitrobenzyl esterase
MRDSLPARPAIHRLRFVAALVCAALMSAAGAQGPAAATGAELEGTSWQLLKIETLDGKTHLPKERGQYMVAFAPHGELSARIDCNRGAGTWVSSEPGSLVLGELATTRAQCPPGSLYDEIISQWSHMHLFAIREGHLFLKGDGGIYEYEPLPVSAVSAPASSAAAPAPAH